MSSRILEEVNSLLDDLTHVERSFVQNLADKLSDVSSRIKILDSKKNHIASNSDYDEDEIKAINVSLNILFKEKNNIENKIKEKLEKLPDNGTGDKGEYTDLYLEPNSTNPGNTDFENETGNLTQTETAVPEPGEGETKKPSSWAEASRKHAEEKFSVISFKICGRCGARVPASFRICGKCGSKLKNSCPYCGSEVPVTMSFCGKCGRKIN